MSQTSFIGIETIDVMIRYNIKHQPLSGRHANRYPIIRGPLLIAKEKVRNLMLVSIKTLIQVWNILQDPVRNQVWLQIHKCSDLRSQTSACYKAYIRCFKPQNPKHRGRVGTRTRYHFLPGYKPESNLSFFVPHRSVSVRQVLCRIWIHH